MEYYHNCLGATQAFAGRNYEKSMLLSFQKMMLVLAVSEVLWTGVFQFWF
jgi:hypothetical protein